MIPNNLGEPDLISETLRVVEVSLRKKEVYLWAADSPHA